MSSLTKNGSDMSSLRDAAYFAKFENKFTLTACNAEPEVIRTLKKMFWGWLGCA